MDHGHRATVYSLMEHATARARKMSPKPKARQLARNSELRDASLTLFPIDYGHNWVELKPNFAYICPLCKLPTQKYVVMPAAREESDKPEDSYVLYIYHHLGDADKVVTCCRERVLALRID